MKAAGDPMDLEATTTATTNSTTTTTPERTDPMNVDSAAEDAINDDAMIVDSTSKVYFEYTFSLILTITHAHKDVYMGID